MVHITIDMEVFVHYMLFLAMAIQLYMWGETRMALFLLVVIALVDVIRRMT